VATPLPAADARGGTRDPGGDSNARAASGGLAREAHAGLPPGSPIGSSDEPADAAPSAGTGAEDFRAVAPPVISFAQGRRR
jgi:hypothetical protein